MKSTAVPLTGIYHSSVSVFPSTITLSDSTGAYPPGWTSYLVEGDDREYTCVVPDINPEASFTWTVGDQELLHSDSSTDEPDGLTTSTSTASVMASFQNHHNRALKCQAINKEGSDGTIISVTIDVKGEKYLILELLLFDLKPFFLGGGLLV